MRTLHHGLAAFVLALGGCVTTGDDACDGPVLAVDHEEVLTATDGQAYLNTPAAAKACHATLIARLSYTGDDALDPTLAQPAIDVSANAVGTGGEMPGLLGILTEWRRVEDPDTQEFAWWAELSAGAKNIDAPAVNYGLAAVRQPAELRDVAVYLSIEFLEPPTAEPRVAAALEVGAGCRR